ncbi:acyltransferase family protein [Pseudomonas brenneri]|uniref:acyltransferase family protein n=1 Tax=Pseudomonas brenneri TaxID=129817 RepID=UPI003BA19FAA
MVVSPLSPRCITYFDCLRFLLAQTVVVGHGFGFFFNYWGGFFPSKAPYIQSIAVVGFFFVSGFLICRSALANIKYKDGNYARYYVDRLSRVYTTLVPCLIFVFLVDLFFGGCRS